MSSEISSELVVDAKGLGKCFHVYERPSHRLLQGLLGGRRRFYDEFWALRGIDLSIRRGETFGIIGRNGSGKSTLLQLIAQTLTPTDGSVQVYGRVAALLELGSGFNPEFTGRENVVLNGTILGLSSDQIQNRMAGILDFADIGPFIDQPVKSYSSGMVMRLAFSVMAHVDADILIIDEALAVGDVFFTQKCMRFLNEFKKTGTLLFVSHDSASVRALCDRAIWLDQGRLRAEGNAKQVVDQYLEAFIAERDGVKVVASSDVVHAREVVRDVRAPLIDRSLLRNDINVLEFHPPAAGFGEQKVVLVRTSLLDQEGRQLASVIGGETVTLEIEALVKSDVGEPIIGFYFRDRMGQELFGDNTYLSTMDQEFVLLPGQMIRAAFTFDIPRLQAGDYHFTVGISTGSQEAHVVQHWVHEALILRAQGQGLPRGIIGLPMRDVRLEMCE